MDYAYEDEILKTSNISLTEAEEECSGRESQTNLAVAEICISVIGIIFNGFAIFIILLLKDYKKSTSHWYVLQLATADTLFLLLLPLMAHQKLTGSWQFSAGLCKLFQGALMFSYFAGMLFLMIWLIAVLLSVPILHWSGKTFCVCSLVAPVSSIILSPIDYPDFSGVDIDNIDVSAIGLKSVIGFKSLLDENVLHPACRNPSNWPQYKDWLISNFMLIFVTPLLIMTVCYSLILWRVLHPSVNSASSVNKQASLKSSNNPSRKSSSNSIRRSRTSSSSIRRPLQLKQQHKVTAVVVTLVVVFFLCWSPLHIVQLAKINGISWTADACDILTDVVTLLAYTNSVLNPILYTFLGSKFQQRINLRFSRMRQRRQRGSSSNTFSKTTRLMQATTRLSRTLNTTIPSQTPAPDSGSTMLLSPMDQTTSVGASHFDFPPQNCELSEHCKLPDDKDDE